MKKLLLTFLIGLPIFSKAQAIVAGKGNDSFTVSANTSYANGPFYGVSIEVQNESTTFFSTILNGNYGATIVDVNDVEHTGKGYGLDAGYRFYYTKKADHNKGFYAELLFSYARYKFTDSDYAGVYEYFSPLNACFGYKIMLGKHFAIDPYFGGIWKLEIRPGGSIDNKSFENSPGKIGLKLGYRF